MNTTARPQQSEICLGKFVFWRIDDEISIYEIISKDGFRPYASIRSCIGVADFVNSGDVTGDFVCEEFGVRVTIPVDIADKARDFFSPDVPKNQRPF